MKIDLNEIAIGIKCFPNFGIPCKFGQLIDDILNTEDSIFDSEFFPRVTIGSLDTLLHGDESSNFLRLSHEGALVSVHPKKYLDSDSTIQLVTDFQKNIAERVIKSYKLKRIHQIGIAKKFTTEKINNDAIKRFIERISFNNAYFVDIATCLPKIGPDLVRVDRNLLPRRDRCARVVSQKSRSWASCSGRPAARPSRSYAARSA